MIYMICAENLTLSVEKLVNHADYQKLKHTYDARFFYYFFPSQNTDHPLVIWLSGGPGCSSAIALFYENGPFTINNNLSLECNHFGWDKVSSIIFLDQPTGTGFSYSSDERDIRHDEKGVSDDLYDFLQAFLTQRPEYVKNELYITGESYAGHYIPAFASRINQGNKAKEGIRINLKGFAIGNGLTDPAIQYKAYADFSLENKLINQNDYESINRIYPDCEREIKKCAMFGNDDCARAKYKCHFIFRGILEKNEQNNYYDIRKKCIGEACYDMSNMEKFLNLKSVKHSLGVGNITFFTCNHVSHKAMMNDWMVNLEVGIPALLEDGINMLIYAGEYDLICNWLGNWRWVHAMKWSGQHDFVLSPQLDFIVDGVKAGTLKKHGPLSLLKVYNAGHMVPMDQPKAALEMLKRWMEGQL